MLSNLVKNGETISVLLTLKYNGFELKYNQSPTTPPPPGGVWFKGLYPYHRKSVVLKPYGWGRAEGESRPGMRRRKGRRGKETETE